MQIIIPYLPFITLSISLLFVLLFVWIIVLEMRLRKLTKGSNGKNLERHIAQIVKDYVLVKEDQSLIANKLLNINSRLTNAVQGIGLVRFNPFVGSGDSKPSFALALLSEAGSGVIVSTLHARDRVTLFSKQVSNFKPESEATEEEEKALDIARNSLHNARHHAEKSN